VQQRGKPRPVSRVEPHPLPVELSLQYRELMASDRTVLATVADRELVAAAAP
jgi:hypothetical protein